MFWTKVTWRSSAPLTFRRDPSCTRPSAALHLKSWDELPESAVSAGWDDGEDTGDAEELNDFEDDFELRMATESEDGDEDAHDGRTEDEI
jgi:hypothetical protein